MAAPSNTMEVFDECVGKRVAGVLFGNIRRAGDQGGRLTLVFDDGSGLTMGTSPSGSSAVWWIEPPAAIKEAIESQSAALADVQKQLDEFKGKGRRAPR